MSKKEKQRRQKKIAWHEDLEAWNSEQGPARVELRAQEGQEHKLDGGQIMEGLACSAGECGLQRRGNGKQR